MQSGNKLKQEKAKSKLNSKRKHCQEDVNWEEVLRVYGDRLTPEEEVEIREYKWIYFLGKIKERRPRELQVLSARERRCEDQEPSSEINNEYR
jgi:hypothetical protein